MVDSKKIGQYIQEKRKDLGYTQQQLAEVLGVTNKAVSKWETGEGLPDISLFPVLAEVLGMTVDELLRGEDAETSENKQRGTVPGGDGAVLSCYQWERQIEKFKKRCLFSLFVSLLGIIGFAIVWLERQDYYSFGIGIIAQLVSICLFVASYWSLQFETKAYQSLYPGELVNSKSLMVKFLCLLLAFWVVVPLIFLDIFAVRLVPFARSSFMDFFVVLGFYILGVGVLFWWVHRER